MKQLKKTILTLALLIAATTQAWAGEIFTTLKVGDVIHVGDQFTISEDWGCINYFFDSYLSPFTLIRANAPDFDPNAAETYVTPDEDGAYYVIQCNYNGETLYGFTYYDRFPATANSDGLVVTNIDTSGMHKVYTFAVHEAYPVPVAWDADTKTGTIAKMPAGNVEVSPEYFPQATAGNGAVTAATGAQAQTDSPLVTVDNAKLTGASALKFCVTTTNTAPGYDDTGWTTTVPTAKDFNAAGGTAYVWYYPVGNDDTDPTKIYSDGDICAAALQVTVAAAPTYDVSLNKTGLADGEPANWKAKSETVTTEVNLGTNDLTGVTKGETVTVTYSGTRKVKSITATVTAPAPAGNPVDLSTLTADYEAQSGDVLSGETSYAVTIPAGATVTLYEVTITNNRIICAGDATIVLAEGSLNMVTATGVGAAIRIGDKGTTLTIDGTGILFAQGYKYGAGIGTDDSKPGGHIVINNGTIIATGDNAYGAGIGTGNSALADNECGDITINNGTITATGGAYAAGIGTGTTSSSDYKNKCGDIKINGGTVIAKSNGNGAAIGTGRAYQNSQTCGDITIGTGVTKVTANGSPCSIGAGKKDYGMSQTVGTITIGGTVYPDGVSDSPFNYPPSN